MRYFQYIKNQICQSKSSLLYSNNLKITKTKGATLLHILPPLKSHHHKASALQSYPSIPSRLKHHDHTPKTSPRQIPRLLEPRNQNAILLLLQSRVVWGGGLVLGGTLADLGGVILWRLMDDPALGEVGA